MNFATVIPSASARLPHARSAGKVLPDASFFVPERDAPLFVQAFGQDRVRTHTAAGTAEVLNAMLDAFDEPCLIHVADGFTAVDVVDHTRARMLRLNDPAVIAAIIENGAQCAEDLDLGVFGWGAKGRYSTYEPFDPIAFGKAPIYAWGVRGAARNRRFQPDDDDRIGWLLQTFARDRIVLLDQRFQFDADNEVPAVVERFSLERRLAMGMEAEFKILVDAGNEAGLSALYEEMRAKGFEPKLIT